MTSTSSNCSTASASFADGLPDPFAGETSRHTATAAAGRYAQMRALHMSRRFPPVMRENASYHSVKPPPDQPFQPYFITSAVQFQPDPLTPFTAATNCSGLALPGSTFTTAWPFMLLRSTLF